MAVTAAQVKELRDITGAGMLGTYERPRVAPAYVRLFGMDDHTDFIGHHLRSFSTNAFNSSSDFTLMVSLFAVTTVFKPNF